jgi:heterodisulfide reductase subunit B
MRRIRLAVKLVLSVIDEYYHDTCSCVLGSLEGKSEMVSSQYHGGIIVNIVKTLQTAERKLEKEAHKIGRELNGLRNAIAALGHKSVKSVKKVGKKRGMSAATRKKIAAAQKKRWAAMRAGKKNG